MEPISREPAEQQKRYAAALSPTKAFLLISLLCVALLTAVNGGALQFIGPQGWAYVLGNQDTTNNTNIVRSVNQQLHQPPSTHVFRQLTSQQYIDALLQKMPLDMKIGQMMLVQFVGPDYSPDLGTMINQYNVGAVLIFAANQNIVSKTQLRNLTRHMQQDSSLPLAIAIDQEGGYVDRLQSLDGPRPSAATIGATSDTTKARKAGLRDAQDLSTYGINLNLAPVADVDSSTTSELHVDQRTYGNTPAQVVKMAGAYLQGLQQSGKVIGTLKHFPGLGDVETDPHYGAPRLNRSKSDLERIDWAPYSTLIREGQVHAIMVTHELVPAIDVQQPSTLSYKLVTGILREEMGFQGVIMTDSLTMKGITDYLPEDQAAVAAVAAGSDLIMGAASARDVAAMVAAIKQAVASGTLSEQRIDASVRRILTMKYAMGLLSIPGQ